MTQTALWRRLVAEYRGLGAAGRGGDRLGHRRPAALARPDRSAAVRERGGYRRRAVRPHLDVRGGLGGALQPGGVVRGRRLRGTVVAPGGRLSARPGGRVYQRGHPGQRHVRAGRGEHLHQAPGQRTAFPVRGRGHRRLDAGHLRLGSLRPIPPGRRRGGRLHRRRLLVHQFDQFRQPGHHGRAHVLQHLCRHRPLIGAELRGRPDRRRAGGGRADPGVLPGRHPGRGGHRRRPPPVPVRSRRPATQRLDRIGRCDHLRPRRPVGIVTSPPSER